MELHLDNDLFFGISTAWIIANLWSVFVALIVLAVGWFIAKFLSQQVEGLLAQRLHNNQTVAPIVAQILRYAVLFVTIIVVLGQFGVQTASILAVLGAAGLAIALALQGTLSNIAAGIMLVFLRPFNTGDYIEADGSVIGTVVEVGLFATQLRTREGVYVFVPNSKLSNAKISNFSRETARYVEMTFNVPRSADLDQVRSRMKEAFSRDFAVADMEPEIRVESLSDSSVTLMARVPVKSREWWEAKSMLQERLKQVLDDANGLLPRLEG